MDDQFQEKIRALIPFQGKKVVWTGFDPETQAFTILFEDKTGINITGDVEPVADVPDFIKSTLEENKVAAKQILALEELYPEPEPETEEPQTKDGELLEEGAEDGSEPTE